MVTSPEKPRPYEGQQEAVKTPDQNTPEVPEYNETGLREMVDQSQRQIDAEQGRVFDHADKRIETAPTSVGLDETKSASIKQGFMGRIQNIKGRISELGAATKARTQETLQPQSESVENKEREKVMEQFQEKRGNMLTNVLTSEVTSQGMDLIPFAGSGKMIVESISGKTLSGKKLTGKDRIIHGAIGTGSLLLDFTGIGEAKDLTIIAGKSIGLIEKAGVKLAERGALKSAAVFEKTAAFMAKHPEEVAKVEQFAEKKLQGLINQVQTYRGGQREFTPPENTPTTLETNTETQPIQQTEVKIADKETKNFSKNYGSLARDILAGQLRQMKSEMSKNRSSTVEFLQGEVAEKKNNLQTLEKEYSRLEQKLDQEKNSFISRLFKRTELSKLEQDLQEKKASLEAVKKDAEERYQMLSEVSTLAGAEQDRAEIRKKLDEFYKDQTGIKEQFENEQNVRSVEKISAKEGVFFIHAMPLSGETQRGSSWNNSHIDGNSVDIKTKLKLVMGLEPALACSTVRRGYENIDKTAKSAGMIIGRGRVLFAKESDAYTITEKSIFTRRSKDATKDYNPLRSDIQQNPDTNIKKAIQHINGDGREMSGYNELIVENPECCGFFFDAANYSTSNEITIDKINELQRLAEEFQVPLYMWKDGKMQEFEGFDIKKLIDPLRDGETYEVYNGYKNGPEIKPAAMKDKMPVVSPETKQQWTEEAVAERPFLINTETQKMYQGYIEGPRVYDLLIDQSIIDKGPHTFTSIGIPSESESRVEKYLDNLSEFIVNGGRSSDTLKSSDYYRIRENLELKQNNKTNNAAIYSQVYAVGKEAKKHGDSDTSEKIDKWLSERSVLEKCKQFEEERIGENGELQFIDDKDIPKEVRERITK
jgi:hypothetical protein